MSAELFPNSDKELWRSLVVDDVASAPVSDMDFAAWLEGRLSEAEAARIEAAVAQDPEMRRAAMELSEILGTPLPAAPSRLEVRGRALVGFEVERSSPRLSLFDWLFGKNRGFVMQRAVALTAAVVMAVSGFMLGGNLGQTVATERYASNLPQTTTGSSSNSNELTEFLVSDGI
jgi:anti-sigma factor RsiW